MALKEGGAQERRLRGAPGHVVRIQGLHVVLMAEEGTTDEIKCLTHAELVQTGADIRIPLVAVIGGGDVQRATSGHERAWIVGDGCILGARVVVRWGEVGASG